MTLSEQLDENYFDAIASILIACKQYWKICVNTRLSESEREAAIRPLLELAADDDKIAVLFGILDEWVKYHLQISPYKPDKGFFVYLLVSIP